MTFSKARSDANKAVSDIALVHELFVDKQCMMNKSFSIKLKAALVGRNLTKLAKDLGLPSSVLHDWVKGSRKPSMKNLSHVKKLANHLGLNFEELVLGEDFNEEKTLSTITFKDNGSTYSVTITKLKDQ